MANNFQNNLAYILKFFVVYAHKWAFVGAEVDTVEIFVKKFTDM